MSPFCVVYHVHSDVQHAVHAGVCVYIYIHLGPEADPYIYFRATGLSDAQRFWFKSLYFVQLLGKYVVIKYLGPKG